MIWQLPSSSMQTVTVVSSVMVIAVVVLASSSLSFFTFIVVIAPPPHDGIPPLPSAPWPDGAVMVKSIHNDRTKNAILTNVTMMPVHANC
jgi:hypothetical protein